MKIKELKAISSCFLSTLPRLPIYANAISALRLIQKIRSQNTSDSLYNIYRYDYKPNFLAIFLGRASLWITMFRVL